MNPQRKKNPIGICHETRSASQGVINLRSVYHQTEYIEREREKFEKKIIKRKNFITTKALLLLQEATFVISRYYRSD